jgi:hypothetical protein
MLSSGRTTSKIGPFFYSEQRSAAVIKDHLKSLFDLSETKEKASQCRRDRAYVIPTGSIFVAESVLKGGQIERAGIHVRGAFAWFRVGKQDSQRTSGATPSTVILSYFVVVI